MPNPTPAYAAASADSPLARATIERRDPGPTDERFEFRFCGVCPSDLHTARWEWPGITFPVVPGPEIVGLGGLGHMGLKFAHAFGCRTVLFTTSPGKVEDAKRLGADAVVISKDEDAMAAHAGSFDFILNTVAASHNLDAYTSLLRVDGTLCLVGVPENPHPSPQVFPLIFGRRRIAGSLIGGIPETQEMLDFCGEHGIVSDIEMIAMSEINEAYERMLKSDVKYRFVIDMATL